ncbi:hypothetical protein NPIL_232791 [Nephila pilipes]|uniref:Uncharacterized protein n=1 Tax=Nephila pilipes TaxID=299642 RepID=A0A8X6Q3V6_NEPPI|nr:hypothetical protein NPIL_232791 [Nephila pilipes]
MEIRQIEIYKQLGKESISRLFIAKAKPSDAGYYSCQPSYADPKSIYLQVMKGEEPTTQQHGSASILWESFLLEAVILLNLFVVTLMIV